MTLLSIRLGINVCMMTRARGSARVICLTYDYDMFMKRYDYDIFIKRYDYDIFMKQYDYDIFMKDMIMIYI